MSWRLPRNYLGQEKFLPERFKKKGDSSNFSIMPCFSTTIVFSQPRKSPTHASASTSDKTVLTVATYVVTRGHCLNSWLHFVWNIKAVLFVLPWIGKQLGFCQLGKNSGRAVLASDDHGFPYEQKRRQTFWPVDIAPKRFISATERP